SLIKEYLTPHVLSLQRLQLSESFLYDANKVSFDWNNFLSEPENIIENGYLEDNYEQRQTGLRVLLQNLQYKDVKQVWSVVPQGSFPDHFCNHIYLSRFRIDKVFTPALQKSVSKKVHWFKGYGLVKKALGLMIRLNCDDEFIGIVEKFILFKTRELQLFDKKNSNNNRVKFQFVVEPQPAESEPAVANPFVTKHHGRPPNRLKNALENVTNTHQNTHSSSNATFNDNDIQEKKRNRCANCGNKNIILELVLILTKIEYYSIV
ncbi:42452_t:CDS:2, partial [Gigaspora margarita]